jgi:hypothetical protein
MKSVDDLEIGREWPYQRGFAAVGLFKPGDAANVGGTHAHKADELDHLS